MKLYGSGKSISLIIASTAAFSIAFALLTIHSTPPDPGGTAYRRADAVVSGDSVKGKVSREDSLACLKSIESGDGYFKAKDYLNAKSSYQVAVAQDPFNEKAKSKLRETMDLLRSQKAQNILFDVAVASADKLFQAGEYDKAIQEYENAGKLLPSDPYPKNKINEIIKIRVDNQVKEEDYKKAIASADKLFQMKSYTNALADYKKAAGIKPAEKYPQDRIRELDALIAEQKAKDDAYGKAIALADQSFKAAQYPGALKSYKDALAIKPEQTYPRDKIKEIEGIMARNVRAQADYDKYIGLADSLYIEKNYLRARENYLMATSVKPSEAYPKEMASKAEKMLTGQEAAMAKALEEQYATIIADADRLFAEKSYEPARAEYVKASNLKPSEQYPKDQIAGIDKLFADALKDKEERYRQAITAGDKAYASKIWETARTEYRNALEVKPDEAYPKTKLAEVEKWIAADAKQKAADARYANSIGKADSLFIIKAYLASKAEFESASKMKPDEVYPKNRIVEINMILYKLEKQKEQDALYGGLLSKADKLLAEKSYAAAKTEYKNAAGLRPDEAYPREKMAMIDSILSDLAALKALNDRYNAAITAADRLFAAKTYDKARTGYQDALAIKSDETYPAGKIAEIDKILDGLASAKALDEKYRAVIIHADSLLAEKSYAPARDGYVTASGLKPSETYPKTRIAEIDKAVAEIARLKSVDDQYAAAITSADKLLADKSYEPARTEYVKASGLKPAESYPKTRIAEIDKALAEIARLKGIEDQYATVIASADKLLAEKSFESAKAAYVRALDIKPLQEYPQAKIDEIDKVLAEIASQKALDDQYAGIIAGADKLLAGKSYEPARAEYVRASDLKPLQEYPKTKIAEIDKALAEINRLKSIDDQYTAAIASADKLLAGKSYEPARADYVRALDLKPLQEYPKTKIAEIDKAMAEIARVKELDDQYAAAIASADKLLAAKSYEPAKDGYVRALNLKPLQEYPKSKIAEIDKALAEVARLKSIDDQYTAAIASADKLLAEKSYEPARAEYARALNLKPLQDYPKTKIDEIDKALAEIARQKALDDQYAGIIAGADKLLAAKSYEPAKAEYVRASDLKPLQEYPKAKIAEIDKVLAEIARLKDIDDQYAAAIASGDKLLAGKSYEPARAEFVRALDLKPLQEYPKTKIAEIDKVLAEIARVKELDDQYAAAIASADKLLADKSYEPAKAGYVRALNLKPLQEYPKTKIAEIDKVLADIARQKDIDDRYAATVADADKLLAEKSWDEAKAAYVKALDLKPLQEYPKAKIDEIDKALAEIARLKSLDDQYAGIITGADRLLSDKSYDQARAEYVRALNLKPSQEYPTGKIAEIDAILADIKAKEDAYKASVAAADGLLAQKKYEEARTEYQNALSIKPLAVYPKEKIADINRAMEELMGKQKFYDNLISQADNSLKDKDYPKAKDTYEQALGVFPDQNYPKTQIRLITARIDSLYRANKSLYDKAVADGDRYFNSFEFDKAIDSYTEAIGYLPMEKYPREMIVTIRRTIAENAIADVLNSPVTIASNTEKQFSFTPVNIASRKNNFVYIKIRNLSDKPFNVLMRYGKDKQPNGGVVMRNLNPDGKINERLVSVRDQDLWSREDNNWISLYPQGGDVEVSFIQVSRAKK